MKTIEISFGSGGHYLFHGITIIGAMREATSIKTWERKSAYITDRDTGEVWESKFWENKNHFGWRRWKKV